MSTQADGLEMGVVPFRSGLINGKGKCFISFVLVIFKQTTENLLIIMTKKRDEKIENIAK